MTNSESDDQGDDDNTDHECAKRSYQREPSGLNENDAKLDAVIAAAEVISPPVWRFASSQTAGCWDGLLHLSPRLD